jgi:hypothetical protein
MSSSKVSSFFLPLFLYHKYAVCFGGVELVARIGAYGDEEVCQLVWTRPGWACR